MLSVSIFSFEGAGLLLSLEHSMQRQQGSRKFGRVFGLTVAVITLFYVSFGVLGVSTFGEAVEEIVTNNLAKRTDAANLANVVKVYCHIFSIVDDILVLRCACASP